MTFWQLLKKEFKSIFNDSAIMLTVFGGLLLYSVLYPLPYLNQTTTDQATVLLDLDNSHLSRKFARYLDATPQIKISHHVTNLREAEEIIGNDLSRGIVIIPARFKRDLLLAKSPTVAIAANANYMLVYSAIAEGAVKATLALNGDVKGTILLATGNQKAAVDININPIDLSSIPVFNLGLGYLGYIVPALFLLILHQTLLIGTGILGASQWATNGYWLQVSPWKLVLSRCIAFGIIYLFFSAYYFGWGYYYYDVSRLATLTDLLLLVPVWLLATTLAGICLSVLFTSRDKPTQLYAMISMPILFISGFVWPAALIPSWMIDLSYTIPAIPAMQAMLQLNQMGGQWQESITLWWVLWMMVVVYGCLACYLVGRKQSQRREQDIVLLSEVGEG
jgi:ABC-2 type transport system permease protein